MNECQVWWTITGNFGNMMPIDWSKSTARAKHLPTLNLGPGAGGSNMARGRSIAFFLNVNLTARGHNILVQKYVFFNI